MYKNILKACVKVFLHIFCIFPVSRNKYLFESFGGRTISCNPLYIYHILQKKSGVKFVWVYNKELLHKYANLQGENTEFVRYKSLKYIYSCMTAKILIYNDSIPQYIPFRKSQLIINTWHGGGVYKKVQAKIHAFQPVSFFVSSSEYFSEKVLYESFHVDKSKILPIGMPRNDILFDSMKVKQIGNIVRDTYGVPSSSIVVLYAPTFRGLNKKSFFNDLLDYKRIKKELEDKFKKDVIFFIRKHHALQDKSVFNISNEKYCFDVSQHQDMQELICTADVLITDYSSTVWDFSLTFKPIFLFVPDFSEYNIDRGFYLSPKEWGMPFATTNEELCDNIRTFNTGVYIENMKKHHDLLHSYETGHATEKICKVIEDFLV